MLRGTVAALYALAMVVLGFAHRGPMVAAGPQLTKAALSLYALPDGTLPTICVSPDTGRPSNRSKSASCDACCLFATPPVLPPVSSVLGPIANSTAVDWPTAWDDARHAHLGLSPFGARGPPLV